MTIDSTFEYILKTWDQLPKEVKNAFYIFKYKHISNIQKIGPGKKIELIQAAGYRIEVFKDKDSVINNLITENDVLKQIIISELTPAFEAKYGNAIKMLFKEIDNPGVSPYVRKAMIKAAGYVTAYVKK